MNTELLTINDVMTIFRLKNRKTIDNWLYSGTLPRNLTLKIGRNLYFSKEKINEFIKEKLNK